MSLENETRATKVPLGEGLPPLGDIVAVVWLDAYGDADGGWHQAKEDATYPPARCISVGKLLQCDASVVALVPHWTVDPDDVQGLEGGRVIIPTGCVVTVLAFPGTVEALTGYDPPEEMNEK